MDLIRPVTATKILGKSRQRVHQLMEAHLLTTYLVDGSPFLDRAEVESFAKKERKSGRPKKETLDAV